MYEELPKRLFNIIQSGESSNVELKKLQINYQVIRLKVFALC